jgi:predicted Zn-dependent protease
MAHEIGHVAARHGTRNATKGQLMQYGTIPLIFLGGWAGYAIYQGAHVAIPLTFLSFSRSMEKEADLLGLEYMYKAGYDPQSFIDFFEKIQTLEKKKPGTMSKVFSTHPPTDDRIKIAQENINRYLKAKPEYVLTTSEFNDVKARLYSLENHRKADDSKDSNRPRLRRNPNSGNGPIDDNSGSDSKPTDSDERPTLKRRVPD